MEAPLPHQDIMNLAKAGPFDHQRNTKDSTIVVQLRVNKPEVSYDESKLE
jgi:hypothetical protein